MREITLFQILEARERRAAAQQELLRRYEKPLICFTMNIPGPIKHTPLIARGFSLGNALLQHTVETQNVSVLHRHISEADTGCEAFYIVDAPAETLKRICTQIEDGYPVGRLFDMDVLDTDGKKLTRDIVGGKSRNCIVCGAPGAGCASRRVHSVPELQAAANRLLTHHFAEADAQHYADLVTQSLLEEVHTTPKPGLVDLRNTGSHRDMDVNTFEISAHALTPYFLECVHIGQQTTDLPPAQTFPLLRKAGLEAEKLMYAATGGVNTHKGAIYSMGILCGALGRLWAPEGTVFSLPHLLTQCALLVADSVAVDFAQNAGDTAGMRLYNQKGLTGIRGEVAAGFPSVQSISLPAFQAALSQGLDHNDAGAVALLHLIAKVEDTNLYHRGGESGTKFAKQCAAVLLSGDLPTMAQITSLDDAFIEKNLSPGGCADLLAITYFLDHLETEQATME